MTPMLSRAKDKGTGFWREGYYACESNHACFEVVGNIHDNPELLKGGESE